MTINEYFEIRVYWKQENGNQKLIKAIRKSSFPEESEIADALREYAGDSAEVVKNYELLPFA